jgi:pimeloyl-ACP methyl ester carboxylesterase
MKSNTLRIRGTDVHYVEAGSGEPVILLHGGLMSTHPVWAGFSGAYVSRMGSFAEQFRVIAPDLRGHGKTANPGGGPITYTDCADDVLALIHALRLDRPMIAGFSAGASVATLAAIREPESVRALVNHAGFDTFNPNQKAESFVMCRQMFGGRPDASEADPAAVERNFAAQGMAEFIERMTTDHDGAQGAGAWKSLVRSMFRAFSTPGAPLDDLRMITAPTLVLTGDRDFCCSVEQAVTVFRTLPRGEIAILPGEGHTVTDSAVQATLAFLQRYKAPPAA